MRKARPILAPALLVAALMLVLAVTGYPQNREKFVISARAGGVNAVTGRATMLLHGNSEWQQLTIKEDLETGDVVRTGIDGRVEMLLNPGSYMRIAENSEVELKDNSLENLEVRLIRGTAIVEVTGPDDEELFIGITTPHTRMSIIRRGLYRVNVVPGDTTELIVRKGRVMLEDSHTKVNGGNKVVFSSNSFSVAKLEKAEKKDGDPVDAWSKERAQTLARANSKLSGRTLSAFATSLRDDWAYRGLAGRSGLWLFNSGIGCYTLIPWGYGWQSPYGGSYSSFYYGGPYRDRGFYGRPSFGGNAGRRPSIGVGSSGGPNRAPSPSSRRGGADSPMTRHGKPDLAP